MPVSGPSAGTWATYAVATLLYNHSFSVFALFGALGTDQHASRHRPITLGGLARMPEQAAA